MASTARRTSSYEIMPICGSVGPRHPCCHIERSLKMLQRTSPQQDTTSTRARVSQREDKAERSPLFSTKNDLPETIRGQVADLLNQRLADCIDLQTQCKQAHWNVKGRSFIGLHKLFDEINDDVEEYVDLLAERVVQLG